MHGNKIIVWLWLVAQTVSAHSNWGLDSIQVPKAHTLTKGSAAVVVAVVDTGIDAYFDGTVSLGWNYVTNSDNTKDALKHGTHVAGIIHAIAPKTKLMPVVYFSKENSNEENVNNTVSAFNMAVDEGVNIINYSGGGSEFDVNEYRALKRAEQKGILVVAAAGNWSEDIDFVNNHHYPAAYELDNIISVNALDEDDRLLPVSNWGKITVDLSAPGFNIYSNLSNNTYGYMTGTSQATAFVSGVAALVMARFPNLTAVEVKAKVLSNVDVIDSLKGKTVTGGKLNAYKAVL